MTVAASVKFTTTDRFGNKLEIMNDGSIVVTSSHSTSSNPIKARFYATSDQQRQIASHVQK